MDAIKIGVPGKKYDKVTKDFHSNKGYFYFLGVLILPQSLRQSSSSQHQQWTLIGLEDQVL